jgi:hypothetical protein
MWFKKKQGLGLKPLKKDERDFDVKTLGWSWTATDTFKPDKERLVIETFGIKNQLRLNTCVCESGTLAKEIQEKEVLSPRFMSAYLRKLCVMDNEGTDLRSFQKALVDVGCATESVCPSDHTLSWEKFSESTILNDSNNENAKKHKSQSFWKATTRDQILKGLCDGYIFHTGFTWYSGYNNIKAPYILPLLEGYPVGGHAVAVIGYDLNYNNQGEHFIVQNSFGTNWGDKGRFYIPINSLISQIRGWGGYFTLDIPVDLGKWINDNQGKVIKEANSPECYLLQGKVARHIPDEATLMSWGLDAVTIVVDNENNLDKIEKGEPLDFWAGKNVLIIKQFIQQRTYLKPLFNKYFSELFN